MTSVRFGGERDDQSETVPRPRITGSFEREKLGGMARKGAEGTRDKHIRGQGTNMTTAMVTAGRSGQQLGRRRELNFKGFSKGHKAEDLFGCNVRCGQKGERITGFPSGTSEWPKGSGSEKGAR